MLIKPLGPVAVVCEKIPNVPSKHKLEGPKCSGDKKICVPKCCPFEEIFNTDNMR